MTSGFSRGAQRAGPTCSCSPSASLSCGSFPRVSELQAQGVVTNPAVIGTEGPAQGQRYRWPKQPLSRWEHRRTKRILSRGTGSSALGRSSGASWGRRDRSQLTALEQFCLWSNEMEEIFVFPSIHSFTRSTNGIRLGSL